MQIQHAPNVELPVFGAVNRLMGNIMNYYFHGVPTAEAPFPDQIPKNEVKVVSRWQKGIEPPMVFPEVDKSSGAVAFQTKDDRHMRSYIITLNAITEGINADNDAGELQEAAKEALRLAVLEQWYFPGSGSLAYIENSSPPSRVSDWATSTGVVQMASLPEHWARWESIHRIMVRPPREASNKFIRNRKV